MAFNIVAGVNNAVYGSVSGSGSYVEDAEVTLEVTANDGYRFVEWDDGNTDNPRVFNATEDVTLVATLEAIPEYVISVTTNDNSLGAVSGSGTFREGTSTQISASPYVHSRFVNWEDGNSDNPRTVTVSAAATYKAIFEAVNYFTISTDVNDANLGSVTGSGEYDEGDTVTLTAVPETGCRFLSWNDGNTDNPRTFTSSADVTYTATFEEIQYTDVTIASNDVSWGTVSGAASGNIETGTWITLTATPAEDYKFEGWQVDGEIVQTSEVVNLLVAGQEMDIIAVFSAIIFYQITLITNDIECGSISVVSASEEPRGAANNIWPDGTVLNLKATSTPNGKFLNWSTGQVETDIVVHVHGNDTVRANFYPATGLILVTKKIFQHAWNTIKSFFSAPTGASKIGAPANNALGATTLADVVNSVGQANGLAQLNEDGKIDISDLGGSSNEGLAVDITGNAATATSATNADVATKLGTTTVGASDTPIYLNAGTATACGTSLAVDITGNAATATTASKLGNTTAIGNVSTPVYISSNGAPTVCNNFASASIAASASTTTPAGWFRIFSLNNGYENGLIIVGGGGWGVQSPCSAVLSFSISNNRPNISLISSGNITTGAGGSTTKIRITCSTDGKYVEAYNNPTAQDRNQFFRILTNVAGATGYNISAGSTPNGAELSYTATVDINKNTEPCLHTTDSAVGSTSLPVYIDANGSAQSCTAFQGSVPIYYVEGPSTDTTAGTWTGSITGLTAYYDGLTVLYVPAVAGASATTLNINGLGAKTCYYTNTSALTTHFSVGTPILLTYRDNAWRRADYNSNTTYSAMSVSEGTTGTATTSRTMRADYLKQIIAALPSASCTGASASCTGNAATATKATQDGSGNTITSTYATIAKTYDDTTNTSYRGMRGLAGSTSGWVRTTSSGIIPSQSGAAGSGHCGLGTSSWYFATAYVDNIYGKLNGNCTGSSASCTGNAASSTYATNVRITPSDGTTAYPVTMLNGSTASTDYALRTAVNNTTVANSGLKCIPGADVAANTEGTTTLVIGNGLAKASADNRTGNIRIHGNNTGYTTIKPGYNSTSNITVTLPAITGRVVVSSDSTPVVDIKVVSSLPASPVANTVYLVK